MRATGACSYLLHFPLLAVLTPKTTRFLPFASVEANTILQAALVLPVILAVSAVYFALVERPCMEKEWPQKLKAKVLPLKNAA